PPSWPPSSPPGPAIAFNSSSGGSRLLSESPFPSGSGLSSYTGPGGNDLSISELSLSDRVPEAEDNGDAALRDPEEVERIEKHASKLRDEKLQTDAFVLKKLNAALTSFSDALGDVGSQNERVAAQLEQTEALLNKYVSILSRSEEFARLVFDDEWQGTEADEIILAQEQREAEEKARKIEAERVAAAQRELERLQREELERTDRKAKEQTEREMKERAAARGGVRGVRGTRASMRATRGTSRGATSSSGRSSSTRGIGRQT
ncbi:hypothetical protein C8R47DRAFT_1107364, partial [Mycena vitilis]